MFKKLSVKITLLVNCILFVVILAGSSFIVYQQNKSLEDQFAARGKFLSVLCAKAMSRVMEEAIDNGVFSVKDAFDVEYTPVRVPNFDPPKFHTKYDSYTDKALLPLYDEFLKDKDILYAVALDVNGYCPTHNTRYQQPITGDKEKDKVGNRTKRLFTDPVARKAATNESEETLLQVYARDTGEAVWDFSTPIYVKGKRWGNTRLGILTDTLDKAKRSLLINLAGALLVMGVLALLTVYLVVSIMLKPLTEFTGIASRMADGMVDEKIVPKSNDELGELADVLERMRISLKTAMDRLTKK